jgi:hypothetical protein
MRPESAAPAAREHPLAFEEHHSRGNLRHAVGPDPASSLRLHDVQFPPTSVGPVSNPVICQICSPLRPQLPGQKGKSCDQESRA